MKKTFSRLFIATTILSATLVTTTSCDDPDFVDSFKKGYEFGYNLVRTADEEGKIQNIETYELECPSDSVSNEVK